MDNRAVVFSLGKGYVGRERVVEVFLDIISEHTLYRVKNNCRYKRNYRETISEIMGVITLLPSGQVSLVCTCYKL